MELPDCRWPVECEPVPGQEHWGFTLWPEWYGFTREASISTRTNVTLCPASNALLSTWAEMGLIQQKSSQFRAPGKVAGPPTQYVVPVGDMELVPGPPVPCAW